MSLVPGDLIQYIEDAFGDEWQRVKGIPLPGAGGEDRRMLFAAVARGLLSYLADHEDDFLSSLRVREGGGDERTFTVIEADLNIRR